KLLLAYGTVSQLGMLTAIIGAGTRAGAMGGLALLIAHALFKATLFLVVGVVDRTWATRDLRLLDHPARSRPVLGAIALISAASMNRPTAGRDRKSTRLNSSHVSISYAVFCLKKKTE